MSSLTLAIDDELLRAARVKAVQRGTSVNEICREAIERFASDGADDAAFLRELRAVASRGRRRAAAAPRQLPSREALMDEALRERLPTLLARL
jgi:hypothetical protein